MSVVIDSRIGDENMLYSPIQEQPENDILNDSKDVADDNVSKDSNAIMEDQMSASNDHLEDGPQQPQHIYVLDRQSSLGKREHDSVFQTTSSSRSGSMAGDESSIVSISSDGSTLSEKRQIQVYGKKKQKLSARQRKRQLERKFGSDFKPGTIRHRLNFLQHSFGDQLALIEESLPKTFFRNMNLETFIKNKMEQHEQHTHGTSNMKRSPSFRRSPERQRKSSIKDLPELPQIKEQPHKQQQQHHPQQTEMAEIMTFAPLETPHFDSSTLSSSDGVGVSPHHRRSSNGGSSFPLDRSAREWRLSKFLEESPPPSPSPIKEEENEEERKVVSIETPLPQVPMLDALDAAAAPAIAIAPATTTSTTSSSSDAAAPAMDAAMPPSEEPAAAVVATTSTSTVEEEKETAATIPKSISPTTPSDAPADVARISATGIVEDVVTTPEKEDKKPKEEQASIVQEESVEETATLPAEQVATTTPQVTEESAAPTAEATPEAPTTKEATPPSPTTTTTEEPAVVVVPPVTETPEEVFEEDDDDALEVAGEEGDDDTIGSSFSSVPEGVVEAFEPEPEAAAESSSGGVVESPIMEPTPATLPEGAATSEPEASKEEQQEEEAPVTVQVKESASQIPNVGEDAPSRGESPQVQAKKKAIEVATPQEEEEESKKAIEVTPEETKKAIEVTPEEPQPEASTDAVVSEEPEPMVVDTPQTAPQDAAAAPAAPVPVVSEGVAEEEEEEKSTPAIAVDTSAAPADDTAVPPSTPVGDQSVSPASAASSFESPRALDAVERARLEQATPVKTSDTAEAPADPPTPDAVERARMEQQTPVKSKPDEKAAAPEDTATKETKPEANDAASTAAAATTTDENKDMQNCPSPNSVMDSELGEKDQKVKKEVPLKENRKIRFADEDGKDLTKEYIIEREANYASRIVVMLLSPRDRKFEFLHAEYPLDESTTVQVLLEQVPLLATNDAFRSKKFNALLQTETSRQLDNNLALQDYCFKESEIVLGIPDDFTVANMTKMAVPLLLNKKLMKTVKQAIRKGRGLKTVQSGEEWRK